MDVHYKRFVEGFLYISSPLTKLTQKSIKFQWSEICKKSFQELEKENDYRCGFDLTIGHSRIHGVFL